ncbi:hypothetical protein [Streptomyces sp. NPDC002763]
MDQFEVGAEVLVQEGGAAGVGTGVVDEESDLQVGGGGFGAGRPGSN